ncbi:3-dehydro-L-gulonate 2-dehydrogenase [Alteromonadaceae bacterium BrNp21-10]|nr:3-dehydro-L-gulonate 2-dehydrogenase [Alteromonadaceae bacterium BrNp21-10]
MPQINRIDFKEVQQQLERILLSVGMGNHKAHRCASIFTQNSCDGVDSHGLNRFAKFVSDIKSGIINVNVEAQKRNAFGMIEQWDGLSGIGPLNAEITMARAIKMASNNGIGCVGLRNTNHWMRGGTYGLQAANAGCIGICWTNTTALMPPWGASSKKIGNNPLVISIPHENEPILLDIAMSQFSNGKLEVIRRRDEQLPLPGGYDNNGNLTTDPNAILESSRALPIGYWKGSGLALALDIMASLISEGNASKDISQHAAETNVSQVFLAIDITSQLGEEVISNNVNAIIEDFLSAQPLTAGQTIRYPGQGMFATRRENLKQGIPVPQDLWQKILSL